MTKTQMEGRLRRCAQRRGLEVRKDRARTWSVDHQGGYMVVDPFTNSIVAGERFDLSLEALEEYLRA